MRRVFLDCDGVLADFDRGFIHAFNKHPRAAETEWGSETFWKNLQEYQRDGKGFYESLPLMLDADKLMISLLQYDPIILTGCPLGGWAEAQKQRWAAEHFPGTKMITCMSKNKRDHMQPGDILIDDWDRHKNLWEEAEGIFIHYKSAHEAILEVHRIFRQDAMIQDAIDSANSYPMPPRSVLAALGLVSKQRSQSAIETDILRRKVEGKTPATYNYQDPTAEMLADPLWNAIWEEVKTWDINVPYAYDGYMGATGNHATAIYLAIQRVLKPREEMPQATPQEIIDNFLAYPLGEINADDVQKAREELERKVKP